jgi:DNA-binding NarL/FixJ family response regulator
LQEHLFSAKEELEDEICKLLDEGMAGKDIAEKLEVSESKVSRIKNKR